MRVLVQEVLEASVTIEGKVYSKINRGFLLFVGFTYGDDENILRKMCEKVTHLRVFPDENGKTNLSLEQINGELLSVSQFTLYADLKKGNRPSFVSSMKSDEAKVLFEMWNDLLKEKMPSLKTGVFHADMKVQLINDGPFTLWLDSDELFQIGSK